MTILIGAAAPTDKCRNYAVTQHELYTLTRDLGVIEKWRKSAGLAPLSDFNVCEDKSAKTKSLALALRPNAPRAL